MLITRRLPWLGLAVLLHMTLLAGTAKGITAEERAAAYKWFDGLGLPDVTKATCVRVSTGWWSRSGNGPAVNTHKLGFLIEEGDKFTVLFTDLTRHSFEKTTGETPEHERVGYEKIDLKKTAEEYLATLKQPVEHDSRLWRRFGERLSLRAELFVIARACAAAGHEDLAARLCEHGHSESHRRNDVVGFADALAEDIAHAHMWQAILEFGRPAVTRATLLTRFEWLAKHFPKSTHAGRAQETAELLKTMVKEDEEHAKKAQPVEKLKGKERIAELVFQLRDQNGAQWSQPGACDIFNDPREEKSPAHQLVKIGYEAVPQLIDVLDDVRFTRSVGYHRDFYFSHHVLRVGDAALAVLEEIAGRDFYRPTYTNAAAVKDGEGKAIKVAAKAWWAEFEKKGEKNILTDAVKAGDRASLQQAARLVERYPDDALATLDAGIGAAKEDYVRAALVSIAGELKGDAVLGLLRRELKQKGEPHTRLAAAVALHKRGKSDEAVDAVIRDWSADVRQEEGWLAESMIGFLASCNQVRAIEALAKDFAKRPVGIRVAIVSALGREDNFFLSSTGGGANIVRPDASGQPSKEVAFAMEDLLALALEDTEHRRGMSLSWGNASFSDPSVAELASFILSQRWPQRYKFDPLASVAKRNTIRVEMLNTWRQARGKEPLPLPKPVTIKPLPAAEIDPLIDQWIAARDADARAKAAAAIEAKGLAALPAVWRAARADPTDIKASEGLRELSQRLASMIREVVISEKSVKPDEAMQKELSKLKGKPFSGAVLTDLMVHATNHLPVGASGIQLDWHRPDDGTGFLLSVTFTQHRKHQAGTQKGWSTHFNARAAGESMGNSSGGSSLEHGRSRAAYEGHARDIRKALASNPYAEVLIGISAVLEE